MTITVREALKIGRLAEAELLAGAAGLDNMIKTVDIIDVPDAAIWFRRDSLLSTTFYALKDNLSAQLQILDDIAKCGGAALVIFSPERYISKIDERLVEKADALSLPLLQMPDCSYIDVIVPVMSRILDRQVEALEYAHEVHNRMTNFVLKGKGLQELIGSLSSLIGHPVIMVDAELILLNYEMLLGEPATTPLIAHLRKNQGYLELAECYPPFIIDIIVKEKRPVYRNNVPGGMDFLFPIVAGDTFYGVLIVPGLERELDQAKTVALEAASVAIALNTLKEREIHEAKRKDELDFFNELLLGNLKNRELIIAQAKQLGFDIDGPYCLILAEINKESAFFRTALEKSGGAMKENLEKKLQRQLRTALDMEHNQSIMAEALGSFIVLLRLPERWTAEERAQNSKKLMKKIKKTVQARMEEVPVCMTMGGIYDNIERISASYMQAWETMDISKKLLPSDFAVSYSDMEAYHLVKRFMTSSSALNLYTRIYDKLLKYDREKNGELVHTLEKYLECNYSRTLTAQMLHIHRNTLNYRLQKINELLGQDVDKINGFPFLLASIGRKLSP
ncbi:MAG: PucR family transcriptional regulator ligand-binding domain-containing protein [Dethiobacter sp.]|jgi:purine catabolism regulator|nr:PucR family transcriptional regulator ligand-binding domain-containing protein [Dethiobacter sp.]